MAISAAPVNTSISLSSSGFGLAPSDGEYLPIVKVQPVYPRRALSRGIEGYVIVEFTVTKVPELVQRRRESGPDTPSWRSSNAADPFSSATSPDQPKNGAATRSWQASNCS